MTLTFDLSQCIILPYKGCSKIENVELLSEFVQQYSPDAKLIVHRDRDYLPDEQIESLKAKMQDKGITLWCTPGTDIESIFVNVEHIHSIYPEIEESIIAQAINDAKTEARDVSLEKFVNYIANTKAERNYRKINLDCEQKYDNSPDRYFYGKKTLGITKSKLQVILRKNPKLFLPSSSIKQSDLESILSSKAQVR